MDLDVFVILDPELAGSAIEYIGVCRVAGDNRFSFILIYGVNSFLVLVAGVVNYYNSNFVLAGSKTLIIERIFVALFDCVVA